jgi:hypothetical protein
MKLRRVYETAEEEGKSVEELALERYGSREAFEEALEERRILDERGGKVRPQKTHRENERKPGSLETRYSFNDPSRPESRNSFRRPGESGSSTRSTSANPPPKSNPPVDRRLDSLRQTSNAASPSAKQKASTQGTPLAMTPIPSVMTPNLQPSGPPPDLNKLQAKVLKAKLMGSPNVAELEKEYEEAKRRSEGVFIDDGETKLEVLPTLDGQGRLYDVGTGAPDQGPSRLPGNRRQKEPVRRTFRFLAPPHIYFNSPLKLETPRQANYFVSMPMTTMSPLGKCCGRRDSAQVSPIRKIWTESLPVRLRLMASLRSVVS